MAPLQRLGIALLCGLFLLAITIRILGDTDYEGPFSIPLTALVEGENLMAVSLHQPYFSTTDLIWGGQLTLQPLVETELEVARTEGTIIITWDAPAATLQTAPTPLGPWTTIITTTNSFTLIPNQPATFFRLK